MKFRYIPFNVASSSSDTVLPTDPGVWAYNADSGTWVNIQSLLSPGAPSSLSEITSLSSEISVEWLPAEENQSPIQEYLLEYKESSQSTYTEITSITTTQYTITGLVPSTDYDIRVRALDQSGVYSGYSNILTSSTTPNITIFDPTFNSFFNVAGSPTVDLIGLEDGITVNQIGSATTSTPLNRGQVVSVSSAQGDTFSSTGKFTALGVGYVANTGNHTFALSPNYTVGKAFSFNANRSNPQRVMVYAFEDANVEISGATTANQFVPSMSATIFTFSQTGGFKLSSDGFVMVYHSSNNPIDQKPVVPSSIELIGVPSNSAQVSPREDGSTFVQWTGSSGLTGSGVVGQAGALSIGGTGSQYSGQSIYVVADKAIYAQSIADSDGGCAAAFVPLNYQRRSSGIPQDCDWIKLVSTKENCQVNVIDNTGAIIDTVTLSGLSGGPVFDYYDNSNTRTRSGTTFEGVASDDLFFLWAEPQSTGDEYNAFGL